MRSRRAGRALKRAFCLPISRCLTFHGRNCRIASACTPSRSWGFRDADEPSDLAQCFSPGPRFGGRLKNVLEHIEEKYQQGEKQYVVSRQVSRVKELWVEKHVKPIPDFPSIEFIEGTLTEGWTFATDNYTRVSLLTDSEIFGWDRPQPRQPHRQVAEAPEAAFADFKLGDYVVHVDYGVGRYAGLMRRTMDGLDREYLASRIRRWGCHLCADPPGGPTNAFSWPDRRDAQARPGWGEPSGPDQAEGAGSGPGSGARTTRSICDPRRLRRAMLSQPIASGSRSWKRVFRMLKRKTNCKAIEAVQARHGARAPDGPAAVRRRGIRQDRGGPAGRFQSGRGRKTGGDAGADDGAGAAAF